MFDDVGRRITIQSSSPRRFSAFTPGMEGVVIIFYDDGKVGPRAHKKGLHSDEVQ